MADPAVTPAAVADRPLTLEEKKAAARARARAARQAEQAGEAFVAISPAAADYIRQAAQEQGRPEGVRLRILAGGCSGLEYKLDLLEAGEAAGAGDREVRSNGVTMLMDLKSAIHVTGSIDRLRARPAPPRVPDQQPERHLHLLLRRLLRSRLSATGVSPAPGTPAARRSPRRGGRASGRAPRRG